MVAAERVFQYVELGGVGGGAEGRPAKLPPLAPPPGPGPRPLHQRGKANLRSAEQPGGHAQDSMRQPLLQAQPLPPLGSGKGSSSWLQAGHVQFQDVWLRYEPWQGSGNNTALAISTAAAREGAGMRAAASGSGNGSAAGSSGGSSSPWVLRGVTLDIQPGKQPCWLGVCRARVWQHVTHICAGVMPSPMLSRKRLESNPPLL